MEKSPLQSLKEWQELSEFFHSTYKKDLISPENTLTIAVDSCRDVIMNNYTLRAKCKINGEEIVEEETFCAWVDPDGTLAIRIVEKMVANLSNRITRGLMEEMYHVLLAKPDYNGLGGRLKDELGRK